MSEELRMDAYYYGFDKTGEPVIDRILSAVACAGKAEHHTEYWSDEHEREDHVGGTCVEWIQNAASDAAAEIAKLRAQLSAVGNFENQANGTSRCTGCGFTVHGKVLGIKYTEKP